MVVDVTTMRIAECNWKDVLTHGDLLDYIKERTLGMDELLAGPLKDLNMDDCIKVTVFTDAVLIKAKLQDASMEEYPLWEAISNLRWFLGNLQIGYVDNTLDKLPPFKWVVYMAQVHSAQLKPLKGFTLDLPKWNGLTGTWFSFSTSVKAKMRNYGLTTLISPVKTDLDKYTRLALTQYDVVFHESLVSALIHNKVQTPRHDYVNQSLWGKGPYVGSHLWDILVDTFDSDRLTITRFNVVSDHTKRIRISTSHKIHEDSSVPNDIISKLTLLPLMDSTVSEEHVLERFTKQCDHPEIKGIMARTTTISALRKERVVIGNLGDEQRMAVPEYSSKPKDKARRVTGDAGFAIGTSTPNLGADQGGTTNQQPKEQEESKDKPTKPNKPDKPGKGNGKQGDQTDKEKQKPAKTKVDKEVWKRLDSTDKEQLKKGIKSPKVKALEDLLKEIKGAGSEPATTDSTSTEDGGDGSNQSSTDAGSKQGGRKRKSGSKGKKGKNKSRRIRFAKHDSDENYVINTTA